MLILKKADGLEIEVSFSYEYSNKDYTSAKWSVAVTNEANQAVYTAQNDVSSTGSWDTYVARTNVFGMLDAGVYVPRVSHLLRVTDLSVAAFMSMFDTGI